MRRSSKKKKKKGPVLLLLILIFAAGLLAFMRTSYFDVNDIIVEGNNYISEQEIVEHAGISSGMNILSVRLDEAQDRLSTHPYLLEVDIERKLPDSIIIRVHERDLVGYLPYMGSFLLVDHEGRVISATAHMPVEGLPVFQGIKVENFQVREILDIDNIQIFDRIKYISKSIARNIKKYAPMEVNVEDLGNVTIHLNNRFVLKVGDTEGLDYKLEYSNTILEKLYSKEVGGEIDVSHGEKAFFRPW